MATLKLMLRGTARILALYFFLFFLGVVLSESAHAKEIDTNEVSWPDAPAWATDIQVNRVVENIQKYLEWDIRKIGVSYYTDQATFRKAHGFDDSVLAFSLKPRNTVALGPRVLADNFSNVFGHELVHIIIYQKFKNGVPDWLEEGLANYIAKQGSVDYRWLAQQPVYDVTKLTHPFKALATSGPGVTARYHYQASSAVAEMIAAKCDLQDLLELSVGAKFETYLANTCGISDVNAEFQKWVQKKAKGG